MLSKLSFSQEVRRKKKITKRGSKRLTDKDEIIIFPDLVSNDPNVIGKLDFLICATKTYDIKESLIAIKKCITKNTVILSLYNGVDAPERINVLFPENEVLKGCVYIVAMIDSPGQIKKIGTCKKLFFGSSNTPISFLNRVQSIFAAAEIESYLAENIEKTVWEKFVFISALASVTCYLDQNIGEILNRKKSRSFYVDLLNEVLILVALKRLNLSPDIVVQSIQKLGNSPLNKRR